ncbi:Pr6Pr family membrane protein [Microbacterium sp. X-17]|uniref:Pr6Pr family membrane protein n=1 Tax=Microbacterium sp. X-17 TaxID=3144404 RepID=UPI0031F52016
MRQSRWWAPTWTSFRILAGLVIVAAITTQFVNTLDLAAHENHSMAVTSGNFFSYFTILSNLGAAVVLLWAGLWWITVGRHGDGDDPRPLAVTLACVTTYMLVTGVVYNTLLRGMPEPAGAIVPWANEIMHVVAPLVLLADLFLGPRRRPLAWGTVIGILVFPLVWVAYTMTRGPLTYSPTTGIPPWYPYPFLYPDKVPGGALGVSGYVVAIAILIGVFGVIVVAVGRWRGRRAARARSALAPTGRRTLV